jgi:hypothetical protein
VYPVDEHFVRKPGHPRTVLRFAHVAGRLVLVNVEIGVDIGLRLQQEGEHIDDAVPLPAAATRLPLARWASEILKKRVQSIEDLAAGKVLKESPALIEWAKTRGVPAARKDLETHKRPGRPSLPSGLIAEVARVYTAAYQEGLPPTKTVAERFQVSRTAAAKWVARARELGELGKTDQRKAGGVKEKRAKRG